MNPLVGSVTIVIALLTLFLSFLLVLKYAIMNNFVRTRLIMSSFFFFIVLTLSISFWPYALITFPYAAPAALAGMIVGYVFGVRTEQQKLRMQGLEYYMEHFAHVHLSDVKELSWWSFINYYTVMSGLLLINFVGLSNVIFKGAENWAIITSMFGALLLGSVAPYLVHLWSIRAAGQEARSAQS